MQAIPNDVDVAIMGAGLAGLTAANRTAEQGLSVVVFEQGTDAHYACNTRYSGGLLHVAFKDMQAPPREIATAIGAHDSDPELRHSALLAEESTRAIEWLQAAGARFEVNGPFEFQRWIFAPMRPRIAGLDWRGYGPDQLLGVLRARLESQGGQVCLGARVDALRMDRGHVCGIDVACGDELIACTARNVIIADGGFQGSAALVGKHIARQPQKLLQRGAGTGYGDGLQMALAAGAQLLGGDKFYGHLLGREAFGNDALWPYPIVDPIAAAGVLVNSDGQRFTDEGRGGVHMANVVAKLDNPLDATVIFDEAIWQGIAADTRYPPCMNPVFTDAGGTVYEADTLEGLAQLTGINSIQLRKTVAAHNALVADGIQSQLERTGTRHVPLGITERPYRAIHVCAGITYTLGGIAIDRESRVLDQSERPLPGLYAAGSATGGIEGGASALYLGGLAKAVVTGLRAAEHITR